LQLENFDQNTFNYPLFDVQLNYTEKCNSKCTTCNVWKVSKPKVLGLDAIENYISSKRAKALQSLYLTGGEPFLDGDYAVEICKIAKKYIPHVIISGDTNGLKPEHTLEVLMRIRDLGLRTGIGVSFNGMPERHDKSRGIKGAHDKALKLMQLLKANSFPFAISYLVNKDTVQDWDYVHSIAQLYGAFVGWSLERTGDRYNTKSTISDRFIFSCPGLKTTFAVSPDGGVWACDNYSNPNLCAGNLYKTPFDDIDFKPVWKYIESGACQPCGILCHARKALPVLPYNLFQRQG